MRSFLAVATCVGLLSSASLAHAADGPTTAIAGFCEWSSEPQLAALTGVVDDAGCVSDESVVLDPHLAAMVRLTPVYEGDREMGKPSGVRTDIRFRWLPAPITDPDDPGQVVFAMNRYESYRELKGKHDAWSKRVAAVGERAGEIVASRTFVIGPAWMKSATAAWVQAGVQVSGDLAFQAPFVAAAPFTGFTSLLPLTAMYAESLYEAPVATGHGASELVEGVRTRDFSRALEGAGEFCGGVGIVLTAAAPMMEAGSALAPRTTPITPFAGRVVPTVSQPSAPIAAAAPVAPLRLAPKLTLSQQALEHVVHRHWENAGWSARDPAAGHFNRTFSSARTLREAIEVAGEQGQWSPARGGRWRVQYDAGEVTGIDRNGVTATRIEIIVEPNGSVVTAYPIP